jgi:DNA helicase-2/ATP-dependent DNA helicase PcrA
MSAPIDFRAELNDEQYAVVEGGDGPCLVLAGAGSGKTRTVVYRVAWLLQHGVAPHEILLLTFTNKAANEMLARIAELSGAGAAPSGAPAFPRANPALWGGTFHSVANRVLRQYADLLGFSRSFTILDQDDAKALIKACVKERGPVEKDKKFPSPSVIQELLSYSRNALSSFSDHVVAKHPSFASFLPDLQAIVNRYAEKKRLSDAMDFDDLLVEWLQLMLGHRDIADLLATRFRYVLVDEYQDTNPLQAALVKELARIHKNVVVVGDDAQSIYSFRAADIRNILDFPKQWPGARTFKLVNNYRSTPEIVGLANDVIARNANQFQKELVSMAPSAKVRPIVAPCPSASQEAQWVATQMSMLVARGIPHQNIAVLFRAAHHSQQLEFELMRMGVNYDYRGGTRFFDRAHVKDALAYLRLVANVADEAAWLRVLSFAQGVGEVTAGKIAAYLQRQGTLARAITSEVETVATSAKARKGWDGLRAVLEEALSDARPGAVVRTVMGSSYAQYLEAEYPNYADRLADLGQLAAFADQYEDIPSFLADATLDDALAARGKTDRSPKLVLSTIHQAKGLEWDAVFVIHLAQGSFPNRHATMDDTALEEERRLFYVAVTRARKHLYLTYPATIGGYEGFQYASPSVFIEELPHTTIDWQGTGSSLRQRQQQAADDFSADIDASTEEPAPETGDEVVELDGNGDRLATPAVNKKVKWQNKSFLRDV